MFDTKREKIYILTRSRIFEYNDVDETFKTLPLRETFLSCFIHDADSNVWVASSVITSYSIHYTKLYDDTDFILSDFALSEKVVSVR